MKIYSTPYGMISHDNIDICDLNVLREFLLNGCGMPNEFDEDVLKFIEPCIPENPEYYFSFRGSSDGIGFIIDIYKQGNDQPYDTSAFWIEDYLDEKSLEDWNKLF